MRTLFALLLSVLIMGVIFTQVDLDEFRNVLLGGDPWLMALALFFFIPQVGLSAYRWKVMLRHRIQIGLWTASKLILATTALNILLPARVGDLSKAYFVGKESPLELRRGMNIVFFEKYADFASLGLVALTGILCLRQWDGPSVLGLAFSLSLLGLFPAFFLTDFQRLTSHSLFEKHGILSKVKHFLVDTQAYLNEVRGNRSELTWILFLSVVLWFVHLFQFYLVFQALHSQVSMFNIFRLVPLAILVGLLPVSIAGVGTRDSAMLYVFAPYENPSLIVGVGLFASLRYFVPGLVGLPFLNYYVVKNRPD